MLNCKAADTPMSATFELFLCDSPALGDDDATIYRSVVRGLQYLAHTRPDLSFAVNHVCQFLHSPTDCWLMVPEKSWCLVECPARWEPQDEGVMNISARFSLS
jgi:hypothetical protein